MKPKVGVVVLNWNGWQDTLACLESIRTTNYKDYEVVVVDNGSSDDSVPRLREACPDLTILETGRNLGFAGGCNVGIRWFLSLGTAKYVWLLNNDTRVHPDALGQMVEAVEADPRVGAVGAVLYELEEPERIQVWGGGRVNLWTGVARHHHGPVPEEEVDYLVGACILLRSDALQEVGLFDEGFFMYWEDADLSFRLRRAGWRLAVAERARVWHRGWGSFRDAAKSKRAVSGSFDFYYNCSAKRFFRNHAPCPPVPICVGVAARCLRRLMTGDWARAVATVRGALC